MKKLFLFMTVMLISSAMWAQNNLIPQKYIQDKEKPTMVMLTASWCGPCKHMKTQVMVEPAVKEKMAEFNVLIVDIDDKNDGQLFTEIFSKAGYYSGAVPTFILLDKNQKVIGIQLGSCKSADFLKFLGKADNR